MTCVKGPKVNTQHGGRQNVAMKSDSYSIMYICVHLIIYHKTALGRSGGVHIYIYTYYRYMMMIHDFESLG